MNNLYMVEINLPDKLTAEFVSLLPEHRAYVNNLIEQDIIVSYNINTSRTKGWVLFNADNEVDVMTHVQQFPIFHHLDFSINEIMIHDGVLERFPKLHLN